MVETHSFSVAAAKELGVKEAIILGHIEFWCRENAMRGVHYHDGRFWTYASSGYLAKKYPYMTVSTVKRITKKLEEGGYVVIGNYNKGGFDRTTWYSITDEGREVLDRDLGTLDAETAERRAKEPPAGQMSLAIGDGPHEERRSELEERARSLAETTSEIVTYLNGRANKQFRTNLESTRKLVAARLRDGFSVDDFKSVIDRKVADWGGNPSMDRFLRPETLFGNKFEGYLNEGGGRSGKYDQYNG